MDKYFLKRLVRVETELEKLRVMEFLAPETMGIASGFGATGLRGSWPMSVFDSNGDVYDISGHGHTLTYTGNPTFGYDTTAPYIALDGTGDYLSRLDEADLDITGTETYVAAAYRGFTYWSWVYYDNAIGSIEGIMSKWDAGTNNQSYQMFRDATGDLNLQVSVDGSATTTVQLTASLVTVDTWYFVAGRFEPSNELKVWTNTLTATNTTSIPASIFSGSANLYLGCLNTASLATGRLGYSGLCAAMLSDDTVMTIFEMTRGIYGV